MRWFAAFVVCIGCTGAIGGDGDDEDAGSDPTAQASYQTTPGLRLLTRTQYVASVKALLDVDVDPTKVPLEHVQKGHGQIASAQSVSYDVADAYYEVSEAAAEAAIAKLACKDDDKACFVDKSEALLRRAFRGPVDAETRAAYLALLDSTEAGDTTSARMVTLIASVLSSPRFLYREEIGKSAHPTIPDARVLSDHEIATRLSYLVWGRGPDDALLTAADEGRLQSEGDRLRELDRLLADPQAGVGLRAFVRDWMGLYAGGIHTKDPEVLAGTDATLERSADESFDRTVDDVLFAKEKSFTALLSVDRFAVDSAMAKLLDLADVPSGTEPRTLDPKTRSGILVHPTVLAAHSKESGVSPFPIGKFVFENVLCNEIGPPIANVKAPPEGTDPTGKTLRQRLEEMTSSPTCQACHSKIGPSGFAFLSFDPIGRYSAADKLGRPWDTSGHVTVGDAQVSFGSAAELSRALATQPGTAACVARRMFRWTFGRFEGDAEAAQIDALEKNAIASGTSVRALLAAIVSSEEFTLVRTKGAP